MSDEAHIEAAHRHRDPVRWEPWHGKSPDEEAMEHEEAEFAEAVATAEEEFRRRRADVQQALFAYLFSGGAADWRAVALRSIAVMRRMSPGMLVGRKLSDEMRDAVADYYRPGGQMVRFDLGNLEQLVAGDTRTVEKLMEFFFHEDGDWLRDGVRRIYLVALGYRSHLVRQEDGRQPSFEDLAIIFQEMPADADKRTRGLARSRWSARAKAGIFEPIQQSGGKLPALFGKGGSVREKYRKAATGNQNRKGRGGNEGTEGTRNDQTHPPA